MPADLLVLEASLGRPFANRELLIRALTHKSLCFEKKPGGEAGFIDNEQLEFLGDSILGFVVSECLIRRYPLYPEGRLSKLKAHLVSAAHLHLVARSMDLGAFLHLGRGEEMSGGREKRALLANALEAVIAAIYLDGGMDVARAFITRWWETMFADAATDVRDAKTRLQEWAQARGKDSSAPVYTLKEQAGPDHAPRFVVEASVKGAAPVTGEGGSKRQAEQDAAAKMLAAVEDKI